MEIETIKIVADITDDNPHGYIIINKDDLTEEHEIFTAEPVEAEPVKKKGKAKEPDPPPENQ
ncbi:hypothetical protein [Sodalis sp. RH16]|uniref:hypothetical protein n=1 Tax=Sodalis sp. RH16 TaxID=3394331 RepID=UPI0039B3E430